MDYQYELDARGLKAPIPVLRLKRAMLQLKPGEVVCLIVDDTHSRPDVQAFAHHARHKLVAQESLLAEVRYFIEKC